MRKILSSIIGLTLFISIGLIAILYYINQVAHEKADEAIETLKLSGFELSGYDSLEIDFLHQSVTLKNLKIASDTQIWLKLAISEVKLDGIDPFSNQSINIATTRLGDVKATYYGENYKFDEILVNQLSFDYRPRFERILSAPTIAEKIQLAHEELGYDSVSFKKLMLSDNLDKVSHIAEGHFTKQAIVDNLPSNWELHLSGMEINQNHLPLEYGQLLADYNITELNGILDVSFNYSAADNSGIFTVNNLNFGGLANLQSEIMVTLNDKRFIDLYNFDKLEANLNRLPIEYAKINYHDLGLYNYFIEQQAVKLDMPVKSLKAQIYFGISFLGRDIKNIERRKVISKPFFEFIRQPGRLNLEFSPAKPVRFSHYLRNYNLGTLVRDLNPKIEYFE